MLNVERACRVLNNRVVKLNAPFGEEFLKLRKLSGIRILEDNEVSEAVEEVVDLFDFGLSALCVLRYAFKIVTRVVDDNKTRVGINVFLREIDVSDLKAGVLAKFEEVSKLVCDGLAMRRCEISYRRLCLGYLDHSGDELQLAVERPCNAGLVRDEERLRGEVSELRAALDDDVGGFDVGDGRRLVLCDRRRVLDYVDVLVGYVVVGRRHFLDERENHLHRSVGFERVVRLAEDNIYRRVDIVEHRASGVGKAVDAFLSHVDVPVVFIDERREYRVEYYDHRDDYRRQDNRERSVF